MNSCSTCGKSFKNLTGLKCHTKKSCDRFLQRSKVNHICPICKKYISNHINSHISTCGISNPCGIGHGWAKGKKYEEIYGLEKSEQIKLRLSEALIGKSTGIGKNESAESDRREKIRVNINERYANGWQVKCGRCEKIEYESRVAGKIKLDGSWELAVAKYLDSIHVTWSRNTKRFEYFNSLKNKKSTYCPDFYISDWNVFIEVKGYTTDLDKIKWNQFPHTLQVWDKKKIKSLGIEIR